MGGHTIKRNKSKTINASISIEKTLRINIAETIIQYINPKIIESIIIAIARFQMGAILREPLMRFTALSF
ncbi:hypothetical protein GCM10026986_15740 [Nitrincola alkalisediminis]